MKDIKTLVANINERGLDITYETAKENLEYLLAEEENVQSDEEIAVHMLILARRIMAEELGIDVKDIKFIIKPMNKQIIAGVRRYKGDNTYTICINSNKIKCCKEISLLYSVLHEFGHIDLIRRELLGQNVPYALFRDDEEYEKLSAWQKAGVIFKYMSNDNEFYANLFACNKLKQLIKGAKQRYGNNERLREFMLYRNYEKFLACASNIEGTILQFGWKGVNRTLSIKDSDCATLEPCSMGYIETAKHSLEIYEEAGLRKSTQDAIIYVDAVNKAVAGQLIRHQDSEYTGDGVKLAYTNYMCMLLCEKLGLDKDKIGFIQDNVQEKLMDFVWCDSDKLYGYFCFNDELFTHCEMPEFVYKLNMLTHEVAKKHKNLILTAEENQ